MQISRPIVPQEIHPYASQDIECILMVHIVPQGLGTGIENSIGQRGRVQFGTLRLCG